MSTADQHIDRQLDGVELDRVFTDRVSGKDTNRPALAEMLRWVREGDRVIVHSLGRLAWNLDDLRKIVNGLIYRGVAVEFRKESLVFTGDDTAMSLFLLSVMGAFAEFERSLIRERQKEGIAIAKREGVYKGRKRTLTDARIAEMKKRIEAGVKKAQVARAMGISREMLYQYLKLHE